MTTIDASQTGSARPSLGAHDPEAVFLSFNTGIARRFAAFVAPYSGQLWLALAAIVVSVGTQVAIPLVVRYAIDSSVGGSVEVLRIVLVGFAAMICVSVFSGYMESWISARLAQQVIFDMRRAMFAHLQKVSLSFMDQTHVGRVMSRLRVM